MKTIIATLVLTGAVGTVASAQDWGGAYGGVSFGGHAGEKCYVGSSPCPEYYVEGDDLSLFGGYNIVNGPWLYGGEVSTSIGGIAVETIETEYRMSNFVDLKLRGGYVIGDVLYFGSLGISTADADEDGFFEDGAGASFSLGADYLVNDRFFVGAEYMTRYMGTLNFEEKLETLSLRAGFKF